MTNYQSELDRARIALRLTPNARRREYLAGEVARLEQCARGERRIARLTAGEPVALRAWDGQRVRGVALPMNNGLWELREAHGARWLLQPDTIEEG